jgi:hypothetical protein
MESLYAIREMKDEGISFLKIHVHLWEYLDKLTQYK